MSVGWWGCMWGGGGGVRGGVSLYQVPVLVFPSCNPKPNPLGKVSPSGTGQGATLLLPMTPHVVQPTLLPSDYTFLPCSSPQALASLQPCRPLFQPLAHRLRATRAALRGGGAAGCAPAVCTGAGAPAGP